MSRIRRAQKRMSASKASFLAALSQWRPRPAAAGPWPYVVAVLLIGGALGLRLVLQRWLGANVPYLQFFPAILVAAWYGGFGPGAVATVSSALAAMYFFLPPVGFGVSELTDHVSLVLFMITGLAIAWLSHRVRFAETALQSEAQLATTRAERLAAIINTSVDGIIVINDKGTIEAVNKGAERLFGYTESEILGRNVSVLMPSPQHEEHDRYLERYIATGDAKIIGTGRQVVGRRRNGSTFPLHLSVGEMWIEGQRKFTGMLHDLSARVQLEQQLRASEARWRAVIDSAVDGIVVIDAHGRIEAFNPAAERLFLRAEREVVGHNVDMLMPSPYHEQHDTYLARYLATGRAKIIGTGREVTGLRADGTTFPLHLSVGEITVEGERKFTGILHDLSARARMEQQLREQEALARIGEMAAVIAHEVKNPLAGVRGAIQVIGGRLPPDGKDAQITKEIIARIDALDDLMKDLLLFARPPSPRFAPVDLNALATDTVGLLREDPALKNTEVRIEGTAPLVEADAALMKIVFLNLLVNGAHATHGRGNLRVSVRPVDGMCAVVFRDDGPGIPEEIRHQVFTPFFTTKARGSGLGLSTAKRLVDAHQGTITIDCPPDGGTAVTIALPMQRH
jgi:PAS domain S-box-containing protein